MFFRWYAVGKVRMRMYRRMTMIIIWAVLVFAGVEYYIYKWRPLDEQSGRVIVIVNKKTGNTPDYSNKDSKPKHSQIGEGTKKPAFQLTVPTVAEIIKTSKHVQAPTESITRTTKQVSEDGQAEKDSGKRKAWVEKVCKKLNVTNALEQPANPRDRKRVLQRFNVLHHIIVNEKHKVLYCFMPKVGCSNLKRIFLVMDGLYPSVEKVNIAKMNVEIVRLDNKKFTEEQRVRMLRTFYKFMLVRDPIERLVSAYRNKWLDKRNIDLHAHLGKRIVEKYRYNHTQTVEKGDDVSFTEYVRYLSDNPSWEINEHWMPYEELCRPCNVKYDFIGSIDTIARDVPHIMRHIHANETKYHLIRMRGGPPPLSRAKQTAANFLRELPRKYFDQLLSMYRTDHELFGYPLPDYETLHKTTPA